MLELWMEGIERVGGGGLLWLVATSLSATTAGGSGICLAGVAPAPVLDRERCGLPPPTVARGRDRRAPLASTSRGRGGRAPLAASAAGEICERRERDLPAACVRCVGAAPASAAGEAAAPAVSDLWCEIEEMLWAWHIGHACKKVRTVYDMWGLLVSETDFSKSHNNSTKQTSDHSTTALSKLLFHKPQPTTAFSKVTTQPNTP
jgi:hypothetical protein